MVVFVNYVTLIYIPTFRHRAKNSSLVSLDVLPEVSKDMLFLHDQACKLIEVRRPYVLLNALSFIFCMFCPVYGHFITILVFNTFVVSSLQRSPNDGAQLISVLKRLLSREVRFIQWKALGCPETEICRPVLSDEGQ